VGWQVTYNLDLLKKELANAKLNKQAILFKSITQEQPKWDSFIKHVNYQFHNGTPTTVQVPQEETSIGGIILRNYFYLGIKHPLKTDYFPEAVGAANFLENLNDRPFDGSRSFINFVGEETPIGVHYDDIDTFYWQCIGSSEWRIYSNYTDKDYQVYTLEPGDIIYAPEGCFHSVITKEPRAAIAFGYLNH
jgi:hypothetical protein